MSVKMFSSYMFVILITIISVSETYSAKNLSYIGGPRWLRIEKNRTDSFTLTNPSEHPYAVLILASRNRRNILYAGQCSGSILTNKFVLTVGHCIKARNRKTHQEYLLTQFLVYAGGNKYGDLVDDNMPTGSQALWVDLAVHHPGLDDQYHDVGLLRVVGRGFVFNNVVNLIKIALHPYYYATTHTLLTHPGKCTVTGFGRMENGIEHEWDGRRKTQGFDLYNIDEEWPCSSEIYQWLKYSDPRKYLIANKRQEGVGTCPGDSGGALVCNGEIHGIVGFFIFMKYDRCRKIFGLRFCSSRDSISFFFDTCQYASWIIPQIDPKKELYPTYHKRHKCWNVETAFEKSKVKSGSTLVKNKIHFSAALVFFVYLLSM